MRTFKDKKSKEWSVEITVGVIKRVNDLLQVNLLDVVGGNLLKELASDPIMLVNVLYVVVKPQADAAGVTDEQFGELLVGDSVEEATDALLNGLADFFPKLQREILLKALAKIKSLNGDLMATAGKKIDEMTAADIQRLTGKVS